MDNAKLDKWKTLLLDTGKRNNLINFKDTKLMTAEVVAPEFGTIFSRAMHSQRFEVFNAERNEDLLSDDGSFSGELSAKEEYIKEFSGQLKRDQLLLYNVAGRPNDALKNIERKTRSVIEETGVNTAYMAFGFIYWAENENPAFTLKSPLLLLPISIKRESVIDPCYIKAADDEITVNPTLSFRFFNDYGIKLPEYDDEIGINGYFEEVEEIAAKMNWSVTKECKIGIFSFLKINMYMDLKDNEEKILTNKNILALFGEASSGDDTDEEKEIQVDFCDLHNVVDADSSQTEAIMAAKCGKSFVLQGPPGTGKSQTITNIIAECLYDSKRVLFVSEKLAALNVVYDKLKKSGLEEFCLELHSHKANKKAVIEELCNVLHTPKTGVDEKADGEVLLRNEAMKSLDDYVEELHKLRPVINLSLYGLYEKASSYRAAPDIGFLIEKIGEKGEDFIQSAVNELSHYTEYLPYIGSDYHNNAWYGYTGEDSSFAAKATIRADLTVAETYLEKLESVNEIVSEKFGSAPDTVEESLKAKELFGFLSGCRYITPAIFKKSARISDTVAKMKAIAEEILAKKAFLDSLYGESVFSLDGKDMYAALTGRYNNFFRRIFSSGYKRIITALKLKKTGGKSVGYVLAVKTAEALSVYDRQSEEFKKLEETILGCTGGGYCGVTTDFAAFAEETERLYSFYGFKVADTLADMSAGSFESSKRTFAEISDRYNAVFGSLQPAIKRLSVGFDKTKYDICGVNIRKLTEKCEACFSALDRFDDWCRFTVTMKKLDRLGISGYVDFAIENNLKREFIVPAFQKAFYLQWADFILHQSAALMEMARIPHDRKIELFREKDELGFKINRAKIKAAISSKRPALNMISSGSGVSLLLREGAKKTRQKSVRSLIQEAGEIIQTLKPCFLMSPLSVSTFLSADTKFDLVIFDEASQVFPQDAVGAVYRGKQLIVVGDTKQMPPSNFFTSVTEPDEDDEEDVTDFESILDICAASFPQLRLKWHYRSRYEELIAFSNRNFYANELITFPSASGTHDGVGVDYVFAGGTFDRKSRTNMKEAEKVADLVFENIEKYPDRSLGVVAFSISQQELIDKLILNRRLKERDKEWFFKSDRAEPFFVKNLETVQGDERDTIIFSIAYARGDDGRLIYNFGPLNRDGGERRLNVAVTRAKISIITVASIGFGDIDLTRTKSTGAKLLRAYLDYAENGTIALDRAPSVSPFETFDSDFEEEVCEFLKENGFTVDTQVGCSSFRIDLALRKPDTSDYVLAIECDGAAYHSSRSARDRDRLRQDILEKMGWKFYRVWSTDWFRNGSVERERLLSAAKAALEAAPLKIEKPADLSPKDDFEAPVEVKPFEFPLYEMQDERMLAVKLNYNRKRIIRAIVAAEAPISEEWLLKRIAFLYSRDKVTSVVRSEYSDDMLCASSYGIIRKNGFLYMTGRAVQTLRVPAENAAFKRDVKYICPEELVCGIKAILRNNITAEKEGLYRLLANQLGFARATENISSLFDEALKYSSDKISDDDGVLSLKDDSFD